MVGAGRSKCFNREWVYISNRIKLLNPLVRPKLLYGCQAWEPSTEDLRKLETIFSGLLRRLVEGGFVRKNALSRAMRQQNIHSDSADLVEGPLEWEYETTNEDLIKTTRAQQITKILSNTVRTSSKSLTS